MTTALDILVWNFWGVRTGLFNTYRVLFIRIKISPRIALRLQVLLLDVTASVVQAFSSNFLPLVSLFYKTLLFTYSHIYLMRCVFYLFQPTFCVWHKIQLRFEALGLRFSFPFFLHCGTWFRMVSWTFLKSRLRCPSEKRAWTLSKAFQEAEQSLKKKTRTASNSTT